MGPSTDLAECSGWDSADCEGTPLCPPRCPRFVDGTGTPVLFRPFEEVPGLRDGLEALYDCEAARGAISYPPYATPRAIAEWLDGLLERGWSVVAIEDGRPVGHAVLTPADATAPEFGVFVAPDYRGRGLASELLRQCIAHAIADGRDGVVMVVERENAAMRSIAGDHGFDVVESSAEDDWIGFVSFRLTFDAATVDQGPGLVALPV
mgnify:FL=1